MGIVSKQLSQSNNMKFLLVLAVAAYARAEADPGFVYSVGAAPLVYHHPLAYHHVPLVYAAAAGCRNNEGSLVPCAHGVLPALAPLAAAAAPAEAAVPRTRLCRIRVPRLPSSLIQLRPLPLRQRVQTLRSALPLRLLRKERGRANC